MSAAELLESDDAATDDDIRRLLSGHLCRCTGYEGIVAAIREAM
jgi:carbon-monoxide dehydrogenase small subunit